MKCPKCGYERQPTDDAPDWQCPACKVAYVKVLHLQNQAPKPVEADEQDQPPATMAQDDVDHDEEERQERLWLAAKGQKMLIYSIVLNFLWHGIEQTFTLPFVVSLIVLSAIGIYALIGVVKVCSGLGKTQSQKILFMVLSFLPLINLVTLVYLSIKTTKALRESGWRVGLFGAKS
ncbi:MAG: hypothetical protein B7Y40_02755 [Gammaproteobacteria bacterium 28-57-27]|nr:MAG: hypothetical protein B7Y40_02755 [Gammaproteobacteria bacterium 28-57-27]